MLQASSFRRLGKLFKARRVSQTVNKMLLIRGPVTKASMPEVCAAFFLVTGSYMKIPLTEKYFFVLKYSLTDDENDGKLVQPINQRCF